MRLILFILFSSVLFACADKSKQKDKPLDNIVPPSTLAVPEEMDVTINPLKQAYFGELHMHTSFSLDAYIGGTRLTPDDAYRAAKGEEMIILNKPFKLKRPLDFCAVTDHAEYIGEMLTVMSPNAAGYNDIEPTQVRTAKTKEEKSELFKKLVVDNNRSARPKHLSYYTGNASIKSAWQMIIDAAEKNYIPGKFTTFIAYEWSAAPNSANLHRNIIFRDNVVPDFPKSYIDINREEELWEWLSKITTEGSTVLAIPHNSNASNGDMFNSKDSDGSPLSTAYAARRQQFERAIEIMQIKGNSEVHKELWPTDEFADFENANSIYSKKRKLKKNNFVRYALTKGMEYQHKLGVNPFKYGIVGGTDNHNGMPSNVEEDNWEHGSHGVEDFEAKQRTIGDLTGWAKISDLNPGALTAVWAESNTRGSIWDAIYRRETYATSGPRIRVRFYGGNHFDRKPKDYVELVNDGEQNGVPMGSDLIVDEGDRPEFLVWALKDDIGPNLDRIQIIKGWYDGKELQEKIFNIALSDNRVENPDGSVEPLDAKVDFKTGFWSQDKGAVKLMTHWEDKEFNPAYEAYYYVRVLQLPTARWNTWDEIREGVKYPTEVPRVVVERAWTSPIWYTPPQKKK
ncbi:DUF3604 domain-containing protein [Sediminitomix flava]|uniref:Uncharacterized protein DUF3604 n=1 Tax=Sediminitomix flava TaxID=379075 RepID=A0A315YX28_SEDFL|nr:DUF3604 domain-containing protein [Sediminitomix flava]PWJ34203.1 uncharacterized protein DUF3604 [Sediminitomix flava]